MKSKTWGEEVASAVLRAFFIPLLAVIGFGLGYAVLVEIGKGIRASGNTAMIQPAMRGVIR